VTAVDTNILVRFLMRDDEKQAETVLRRFQSAESRRERLRVSLLVVLELIWVLESVYEVSRFEILRALQDMRHMAVMVFEADTAVDKLLQDGLETKVDLSDILIARASEALGCETVLTFDKKAAKSGLFQLLT